MLQEIPGIGLTSALHLLGKDMSIEDIVNWYQPPSFSIPKKKKPKPNKCVQFPLQTHYCGQFYDRGNGTTCCKLCKDKTINCTKRNETFANFEIYVVFRKTQKIKFLRKFDRLFAIHRRKS
jgi:hypothetical protein